MFSVRVPAVLRSCVASRALRGCATPTQPFGRTSVPITDLVEAIHGGITMEDVAKKIDHRQSPMDALKALELGNARFFSGTAIRPEKSAMERRSQIISQAPFACVLSCADSRVPVEIVFDQSLGDLFVVRMAGNVATSEVQGSIEYAVQFLKCKLVVVMGHEGCGAVRAAMQPAEALAQQSERLRGLLAQITPAVTSEHIYQIRDLKARSREAATANVIAQVLALRENPVLKAKVESNELLVVGAFYEITSGICDFFHP